MANCIFDFLKINNLFEVFKSHFREHHNTESALIRVTNDLLISSDKGLLTVLVLLDLGAAFDIVYH